MAENNPNMNKHSCATQKQSVFNIVITRRLLSFCLVDPELFCARGKTLMALGKFPEAIYDFTWALKLGIDNKVQDKDLSKYNRFAGNCYFEMSQYPEAQTHYK